VKPGIGGSDRQALQPAWARRLGHGSGAGPQADLSERTTGAHPGRGEAATRIATRIRPRRGR